jgi:hypothetical protein
MAPKSQVAGLTVFRLFDGQESDPNDKPPFRDMGVIDVDYYGENAVAKAAYWWLRYRNQGWSQTTSC